MRHGLRSVTLRSTPLLVACLILAVAFPWVALARAADVAVVDVEAPIGAVTLAPGQSAPITITITVSGKQEGTATFKVYRDWTLSGGTFTGANPQEFTVPPRAAADPATTFSTSGTVMVAAGQADGTFTIVVGVFDITNSNPTGAKLSAGAAGSYEVAVETPQVVDEAAPTITITAPEDGAAYLLGEVVLADYACEDEQDGSGVASCVGTVPAGDPIDTATVGSKTFTVDAEDNAGNTAAEAVSYSVVYDFSGFYRPLLPDTDALNVAKAGSAVPLKFGLAGDQGLDILAAGYPQSRQVDCETLEPLAEAVAIPAVGPGRTALSYDPEVDQYVYVWKTDRAWAGSCRLLTLVLVDDVEHTAYFRFSR